MSTTPASALAPRQRQEIEVAAGRPRYPTTALEQFGIRERDWIVLVNAIFPSAVSTSAVELALAYCMRRGLDIFKKPVHIVPIWSSKLGANVETVWPGIAELRATASRTKGYAGSDATEFGPTIARTFKGERGKAGNVVEVTVEFPEWAQKTVYRMVDGQRCAFVGPKVYWLETYSRARSKSEVPTDMWERRPSGQLEKCTEAASLRAAFPEELGGEYAAEEMEGRFDIIDVTPPRTVTMPRASAPAPAEAPPAAQAVPHTAEIPATAGPPPAAPREREPGEDDEPGGSDEPTIPADAWAPVRQAWHSNGTISEAQGKRLFAVAMGAGWTKEQFVAQLKAGIAGNSRDIPSGEPYELIVKLFEKYGPGKA